MDRTLPLLVLAALLVVAGCVAPANDPDPDAIVDRVDQRLESLDTLQMNLTWHIATNGSTSTFRYQVAYQHPNHVNLTYREPTLLSGIRVVSNGTRLVATNPNTGRYTTANVTENGTGVSALFLGLSDTENVTFEGNETVAGDDAVKLSYAIEQSKVSLFLAGGTETSRIAESTSDDVNVTVWVDRERWVPVRASLNFTGLDPRVNMSYRYEDVELDASIPDRRFETAVGPDATRVESILQTVLPGNATVYTNYGELTSAVGPDTIPRTLPGNFTFREGYSSEGDAGRLYRLFYTNTTVRHELQYYTTDLDLLRGNETATVDGRTVETAQARGTTIVQWHCGDSTYLYLGVSPRDDVLDTAGTIGCPTDG